jgi:hypothetical protein
MLVDDVLGFNVRETVGGGASVMEVSGGGVKAIAIDRMFMYTAS